jgi:hypothetical protein
MEYKGIHKTISNEKYHAEKEHLSSSNLKMLLKDTKQFYKDKILGEGEPLKGAFLDEGNYAHSLILEPHMVDEEYSFFEGNRKAGKDWKAFEAEHKDSGKIILSAPQKLRVENWVKAYNKRPEAVDLVKGANSELSLFSEMLGVPLKVRADIINVEKGFIADVKTTASDPDVDTFRFTVEQYGYDLSAALYVDMFSRKYEKPFDFYFIVLGKRTLTCEVYKASDLTLGKGRRKVMNAIKIYKGCLESGKWDSIKEVKPITDYEILEV